MRAILQLPLLTALLLYYTAALVLLVAYLVQDRVPVKQGTAVSILLLPSIGWGLWQRERLVAQDGANAPPIAACVLGRMGTLHALLLCASLLHLLLLMNGAFHVHDPFGPDSIANRSNNAAAIGFDMMLAGVGVLFGLFLFFAVLFTYALLFVFVSVLPWSIASSIRRGHQHARIVALEAELEAKGRSGMGGA